MKSRRGRNRKGPNEEAVPKNKITELLDIPAAALSGLAQIELSGNQEAVVDGCQGVLEYDENVIKLTTGKMAIKFCGRGLQIKVLTHDSAVVTGFFTSIEFLT